MSVQNAKYIRTQFIKRRAFPIQNQMQFNDWAKIRLTNANTILCRHHVMVQNMGDDFETNYYDCANKIIYKKKTKQKFQMN